VAILVGSQDHQTQIWKGVIQGPFHQSLVQIGPVASEFGVISSRLKRFLEKLIDLDQTGFISGRYIGDNIRLIYDMSKNMVFELLVSFGIQMVKY
jgi:hypothetical protein